MAARADNTPTMCVCVFESLFIVFKDTRFTERPPADSGRGVERRDVTDDVTADVRRGC